MCMIKGKVQQGCAGLSTTAVAAAPAVHSTLISLSQKKKKKISQFQILYERIWEESLIFQPTFVQVVMNEHLEAGK